MGIVCASAIKDKTEVGRVSRSIHGQPSSQWEARGAHWMGVEWFVVVSNWT